MLTTYFSPSEAGAGCTVVEVGDSLWTIFACCWLAWMLFLVGGGGSENDTLCTEVGLGRGNETVWGFSAGAVSAGTANGLVLTGGGVFVTGWFTDWDADCWDAVNSANGSNFELSGVTPFDFPEDSRGSNTPSFCSLGLDATEFEPKPLPKSPRRSESLLCKVSVWL